MWIKTWRRFLFHPLIVGFFLSIVVVFLLAKYSPQYSARIVEESVLTNKGEVYYFDLDQDGNSEKINFYHYDRVFKPTLYLYDAQDNFKALWNFFELPVKNAKIFAGDFNNDNIQELFVFTQNSDSLFLYVINPENDHESHLKREFVFKVHNLDSNVQVNAIGLFNLNQHANKEFLFVIDAGYPQSPKRIFSIDISTKELNSSPEITTGISNPIIVEDLNADGLPEIVLSNRSVDVPGSANEAKLIVLDQKLNYLFQPIIFYGGASQITVKTIVADTGKFIAVLHSGTIPEMVFNSLMLFNAQGENIFETNIENKSNLVVTCISDDENSIYLLSGKKIFRYTPKLKKDKSFTLNRKSSVDCIQCIEITGDSKKEILFRVDEGIIIVSDDLKHQAKLNIPETGRLNISVAKRIHKPDQISIQVGSKWYLCEYNKNSVFFHSQIFYLLVYILITLLTFLIAKVKFRIKNSLIGIIKNDLIDEIEDNIEENFIGLKTKIKKIGKDLESNSFKKILVEIDDTFEKVKSDSKKASLKYLTDQSFENQLSLLIESKKELLSLSFQKSSNDSLNEIHVEIKNAILELAELCFDLITEISKKAKVVVQLILHNNELNLLMEIENVFIEAIAINKNVSLNSLLKKVNGEAVVDTFAGFGTLLNVSIPLDFKDSLKEPEKGKIRIVIAEDHDVSLFGLVSLFKTKEDIEVVGTAKNGMEVLKLLETKNTDIVITDISMPGMDGIELSERLKNEYPTIKVIAFTMYLENWFVDKLMNNGAKGYVSKNSKITELVEAVHQVYEGHNYYCPQFKSKFGLKGSKNGISKKLDSLTKNELYIVNQYAENLNREQIAAKMHLNLKVIDTFMANILLKLNAGDEDEVMRIAKKQKFISD